MFWGWSFDPLRACFRARIRRAGVWGQGGKREMRTRRMISRHATLGHDDFPGPNTSHRRRAQEMYTMNTIKTLTLSKPPLVAERLDDILACVGDVWVDFYCLHPEFELHEDVANDKYACTCACLLERARMRTNQASWISACTIAHSDVYATQLELLLGEKGLFGRSICMGQSVSAR